MILEDELELDTRREIYNAVKKYPGCHFRGILRRTNLSSGVVKYHLSYLVRRNLIREDKGDRSRYFSLDINSEGRKLLKYLRQRSLRRIIVYILSNKNCNQEDIVKFVKLSPSTVSWHLNKLNDVVEVKRVGRKCFFKLKVERDVLVKVLVTYKASFLDSLVDNVIEMWDV